MIYLDTEFADWDGTKPDGRVWFSVYDDQVIRYDVSGKIDKTLIQCFAEIHEKAVEKIKKDNIDVKWCALVVFKDIVEITDDAIAGLVSYLNVMHQKKRLSNYTALVFPDETMQKNHYKQAYIDCFLNAGAVCQAYDGETQALDWLNTLPI